MDWRARLFEDPTAFALGCLVWFPLALCILALLGWMITGEIDVIFGIVGILMAVGLGYVSIAPPTPKFPYFSFPAVVGTVILFPFMRHAINQRALKKIDLDDLEKAHEALRLRPDNVAARFKIAKMLFEMGFPGHALHIAEYCLQNAPRSFFEEEHRMVAKWKRTHIQAKAFDPIRCSECGQSNPPGDYRCSRCGAPFLLNRVKGRLLPSKLARKLLASWIVMVVALIGVPFLASLGGFAAAVGIVGLMVLAIGTLAMAFWDREAAVYH